MKEDNILKLGMVFFFYILFSLANGTCHPTLAQWLVKKCMLYIIYTLNVPNPLYLIVGSKLILT
jgi:hypothetical protein